MFILIPVLVDPPSSLPRLSTTSSTRSQSGCIQLGESLLKSLILAYQLLLVSCQRDTPFFKCLISTVSDLDELVLTAPCLHPTSGEFPLLVHLVQLVPLPFSIPSLLALLLTLSMTPLSLTSQLGGVLQLTARAVSLPTQTAPL